MRKIAKHGARARCVSKRDACRSELYRAANTRDDQACCSAKAAAQHRDWGDADVPPTAMPPARSRGSVFASTPRSRPACPVNASKALFASIGGPHEFANIGLFFRRDAERQP